MTVSDDQKLLCIESYTHTKATDWKRICKYSTKWETIRVFENKKENLYVSIFITNDEDDDPLVYESKLTNKPEDYVFGISEYIYSDERHLSAFIQPKFGEPYDQERILDFCLGDADKFGFSEDSEATYSYSLYGIKCESSEILKEKLIELGLEHNPKFDQGNKIQPSQIPNILYCQLEETDYEGDVLYDPNFSGIPEYDFINELYNSKNGCSTYTLVITTEDRAKIRPETSIKNKWIKIEFVSDSNSESSVYKNFSDDAEHNIRIVKVEIVPGKSFDAFESQTDGNIRLTIP